MAALRIHQVAAGDPGRCGIALFAQTLAAELTAQGLVVRTGERLPKGGAHAELILIHHHSELPGVEELLSYCRSRTAPIVLFAHSEGLEPLTQAVDGIVAMCPGMIAAGAAPLHLMNHPAWIPASLGERSALRGKFGLPADAFVIGASGFLKLEREFDAIVGALLEAGAADGWVVQLVTSPWRLASPGLTRRLVALARRHPGRFVHVHEHLGFLDLNLRLQACDLLWCWTRAPSSRYASGVASDLYASGTRLIAADKLQHRHILDLPNVVRAPATLPAFIDRLIGEARGERAARHDPAPVRWTPAAVALAAFLAKVALDGSRHA